MTEIDVSQYKRAEETQRINEKRENKLINMQLNDELQKQKPPDPLKYFKYKEKPPDPQKEILKKIQLEQKYQDIKRNQYIKELFFKKKEEQALKKERAKLRDSKEIYELKDSVYTCLSYPYKDHVIKRQILENELKQSDYLNDIVTEKLILDNILKLKYTILTPLLLASKYLETEKKYNVLLANAQMQKQKVRKTTGYNHHNKYFVVLVYK